MLQIKHSSNLTVLYGFEIFCYIMISLGHKKDRVLLTFEVN